MKRVGKILSIVVGLIAILLAIAINLTIGWRPFIGPRSRPLSHRTFERTPQRLERGRYLAENLMGCVECHSEHDFSALGAPPMRGKLGAGEVFPVEGLPGRVVAPNLTPDPETGSGTWTDDQLARAIREGIGHDGRTLFPLMPYEYFRHMSDEDLASVVVFLRTLPPLRNLLPKTQIVFPVKYLMRSAPEPVTAPVSYPNLSSPVKRGEYLVKMATCMDCHSPQVKGKTLPGMQFAGGFRFKGPFGDVASANITPDLTGISYYDEELFLKVMHTGSVGARKLNPVMPWNYYRNLTDEDLKEIFAYLRTVQPVQHRVDNSERPTLCKLDNTMHGGGDRN